VSDGPTREDLRTVCELARRFDATDFVAGEWILPAPGENGVAMLGTWLPSADVARWQDALYEHHVVLTFDWTDSRWTRQMRRYYADPSALGQARLLTIRNVVTTLVRAERFCEGTLARAFDRGVPQAAMQRLRVVSTGVPN